MAKNKNKPVGRSKACATKCMHAVLSYMKEHDGCMSFKDVSTKMPTLVTLDEWELARAGKKQNIRWWSTTQFYSVDYVKAGFIVKRDGVWYLTPEGEEVLKKKPEEIMSLANEAYKQWEKSKEVIRDENEEADDIIIEDSYNIEELVSLAKESIIGAIRKKNAYDFQDLVAAVLRAMGYYTPFVAPKGKDGGVDIIAYHDPLGATTPRLKVQVKHKPDTPIPANDIRALRGVMSTGDVGLFVTSGSYSHDAKKETTVDSKFIRLVDGDEFISMWETYFDKMTDEDKNLLPLKKITFLGTND